MLRPVVWNRVPGGALVGECHRVPGGGLGSCRPAAFGIRMEGLAGLGDAPAGLPFPEVQIPADVRIVRIPDGLKGTEATLKVMKQLVLSPWGARNPRVVMLANQIRDHVASKDYVGEADAIFNWVKSNVAYKLDPAGLEWVQTPLYTMGRRAGDCDDHSTMIAALAMASGHRAAFRTVRGDPGDPTRFSHVYAVIGVVRKGQTEWYSADSTQAESYLGWDPPGTFGEPTTWVIDPSIGSDAWNGIGRAPGRVQKLVPPRGYRRWVA